MLSNQLLKNLLDLIFPKNCVGCQEEGFWFCPICIKEIKLIKKQCCYLCKRLTSKGKICPRCKNKSNLAGVLIAAKYKGIIKEAIREFKYNGLFDMAKDLSSLLTNCLNENELKKISFVLPIPLYRKRLIERGYNQSELLAKELSLCYGWKLSTSLAKIKPTLPQVGQKSLFRRKNLDGAFFWKGGNLDGKNVLIVDDVLTTGATLEEAAKELKNKGAKAVWGIVLSRGDFKTI